MAPHDEETAYGPLHGDDMDNNGANRRDEATNLTSDNSYAAGGSGTSSMPNPYGPDDYNRLGRQDQHDNVYDDDYMSTGPQQGASGAGPGPIYSPPSASDAYDADRPARFPPGNYS